MLDVSQGRLLYSLFNAPVAFFNTGHNLEWINEYKDVFYV